VTRLRLVHLIVQPVLMADDGEHLTPVEAGQMIVAAADLDAFPVSLREQIAEQEAAFNASTDSDA
jgi:hypothetical protein